jgi:hypothetical protein
VGVALFLTVAWADRHPGAGPQQLRGSHLGLVGDDGGQDVLGFALRHLDVVERAGDFRSHLVELFRGDAEILVGLVQLLPV